MRKLFTLCLLMAMFLGSTPAVAQQELGILNTFAVGANLGTTGYGFDVAAPLTPYFSPQIRNL